MSVGHFLLLTIGVGTVTMLALATAICIDRDRLRAARVGFRDRLRTNAPFLVSLLVVLVVNKIARQYGPDISWVIGWNITGWIHTFDQYLIEETPVVALQSLATPWLTAYLSFVYVYGYLFLLLFPFIAYFVLDESRWFEELTVAYIVNYGFGLVCYLLFVSYGPRNLMPDLVDSLLYVTYPSTQLLTGKVNANTNVFPSLHTSLSATVTLLAWRTRAIYPRWLAIATVFSTSIIVATMYLGIHWAADVIAGLVLAGLSIAISRRVTDRVSE